MILSKNTPGVGQYNPKKSSFDGCKGPTMGGKYRPEKNMNPGPSDYHIKSLSPVRGCTIGNEKLMQLASTAKAPKKITIDLQKKPGMPSAQSFMHTKPSGAQIAQKLL